MTGRLISQRALVVLIVVSIVLVITLAAVLAFGAILGAMGDETGSTVLHWIAAGVGMVLAVDLICLILTLAIHATERSEEPTDEG